MQEFSRDFKVKKIFENFNKFTDSESLSEFSDLRKSTLILLDSIFDVERMDCQKNVINVIGITVL